MFDELKFKLLTLVVCGMFAITARAAPHYDAPTEISEEESSTNESDKKKSEQPGEHNKNQELKEAMAITPAPSRTRSLEDWALYFNKSNYYYPYKQELEVHVGAMFGVVDSSDDDDDINTVFGFNYLLPAQSSPRYEIGAALTGVGYGHLHAARRIVYNEKGAFRPYYEYGVLHKLVPDEKMASFSNFENYLALATIGFADIANPPRSTQIELQFAIGGEDTLIMFTYGYAWGF